MIKEISWHLLSAKDAVIKLNTNAAKGLFESEVVKLQKHYGKNILKQTEKMRFAKLLASQFKSPLVFILIIAGIITLFLREWADAIVIFLALFINAGIGIAQEGRAGKAFEKLRASQEKFATVIRDGGRKIINAEELVIGDIILVNTGDSISADARIIEAKGLEINESALTGEWVNIEKNNKILNSKARITEQSNMLFAGTLVVHGWAKAVVTAIGAKTEFGKIAEDVSDKEPRTPFQKNVAILARFLGLFILLAVIFIFIVGIARGEAIREMFLVAVAIAVAAIPSGLPVAVTVVLALGMENILKKGGLVKRLKAAGLMSMSLSQLLTV